jgi:hypothetical protein
VMFLRTGLVPSNGGLYPVLRLVVITHSFGDGV